MEPEDIVWENLPLEAGDIRRRQLVAFLIETCILIVSLVLSIMMR